MDAKTFINFYKTNTHRHLGCYVAIYIDLYLNYYYNKKRPLTFKGDAFSFRCSNLQGD